MVAFALEYRNNTAKSTQTSTIDVQTTAFYPKETDGGYATFAGKNQHQVISITSLNEPMLVKINRLPGHELGIKEEIPVKLVFCDDEYYIAYFEEANIAMSGDSAAEALSLLREHIAALYEVLREENELGPEPSRQIAILESYIGEPDKTT